MIFSPKDCEIIRKLCKDRVIVATAGTFDLLHVGHINHLEYCRKFGDCLIVLMSSDARVRQKKGLNRPIIPQGQRAKILDSLEVVDFVVIGFDPKPNSITNRTIGNRAILEIIRPKVFIVRNQAWEQDREILKSWGIELRIEPKPTRLNTTTEIVKTIVNRYGNSKEVDLERQKATQNKSRFFYLNSLKQVLTSSIRGPWQNRQSGGFLVE